MTSAKITKSGKSINIAFTINSKFGNNTWLCYDSFANDHVIYDSLLLNNHNEAQLPIIQLADNSKLRVLDKNNSSFTIMIDDQALNLYVLNFFHFLGLKYNPFSVDRSKSLSPDPKEKNNGLW